MPSKVRLTDSLGTQIYPVIDPSDKGTKVVANPTLAGTENNLTGIQVGETKYKVPAGGGGGSNYDFLDKKILSEDIISFNESLSSEIPNFNTFMNNTFANDPNFDYIEWWRHFIEDLASTPFWLPKDYRFTLVYSDGSSSTFSFSDGKDVGQYPTTPFIDPAISTEWNYNYSNVAYIEATSENSGDITFELSNGSSFTISMSIEADPETGDPRLSFGNFSYEQGTSSIPVLNVTKLIVWMPSCNTHFGPIKKFFVDEIASPSAYHDDFVAFMEENIGYELFIDPLGGIASCGECQWGVALPAALVWLKDKKYKVTYNNTSFIFAGLTGYADAAAPNSMTFQFGFRDAEQGNTSFVIDYSQSYETDAETGDTRVASGELVYYYNDTQLTPEQAETVQMQIYKYDFE